jgi:hypothetical protein
LPQLLVDDVERLIMIDNGDAIVLRDLSEMYNWNMGNNIYMGVPDQGIGKFGIYSNKSLCVYINGGNYLIDVKKVKEKNMYEKFRKYKNLYNSIFAEQDMISDIAYGQVGYLPIRFGLISPYQNDSQSDIPPFKTFFEAINLKKIDINHLYNINMKKVFLSCLKYLLFYILNYTIKCNIHIFLITLMNIIYRHSIQLLLIIGMQNGWMEMECQFIEDWFNIIYFLQEYGKRLVKSTQAIVKNEKYYKFIYMNH